MKTIRERFLERKVGQWLMAYMAGLLVCFQLLDVLSQQFEWPNVVGQVIIVLLGMGCVVTCVLAWYHGEKGRQRPSGTELLILTLLFVAAGLVLAAINSSASPFEPGASASADAPEPNSLAILYLDVHDDDEDLRAFADYLTETLIGHFTPYSALDVRSALAVESIRGEVPGLPEIARLLDVALIVSGHVRRASGRILLNVEMSEAASGRGLWSRLFQEEVGKDGEWALAQSIVPDLADALRVRLGLAVHRLEWQAGTRNREAWENLLRARRLSRIAGEQFKSGSRTQAFGALDGAEALLLKSAGEDPTWSEPLVQLAKLAELRAVMAFRYRSGEGTGQILADGLALVDRVFALDPGSPAAHFLRGNLTQLRLRLLPQPDADSAAAMTSRTEFDFLSAVGTDPSLAGAWAKLSLLRFERGDYRGALDAAMRAHEQDAFLEESEQVLIVLAQASFEDGAELEALDWCREGQKRHRSPMFLECELEIRAWGHAVNPEARRSGDLAARIEADVAHGALGVESVARVSLTLSGALARAGMNDQARSYMARAKELALHAGADLRHLWLWESAAQARLDEIDVAVQLLRDYVEIAPNSSPHLLTQKRFALLRGHAGYEALVAEKGG